MCKKLSSGLELTLPNSVLRDLMQAALERGAIFSFRAYGWSMSPFIRQGDVISVYPIQDRKPTVGQVIAFIQPGTHALLIHRVVRIQGTKYLIQGDNMPGLNDGLVPEENILGCVTHVRRNGKNAWYGQGMAGYFIAYLSRLGLLALFVSLLNRLFRRKRVAGVTSAAKELRTHRTYSKNDLPTDPDQTNVRIGPIRKQKQ